LIKTAHQHLLLLVGFDTLIYRKYYDTPPILVGHQPSTPEVKPLLPALFRIIFTMVTMLLELFGLEEEEEDRISLV
jgi:hypothetical protein